MHNATSGRGLASATLAVLMGGTLAVAAAGVLLLGGPLPVDAATADSGLMVSSITPAVDYAGSHLVYAAASRLRCSSNCGVLLRSDDGGHSWTQVGGAGWTGQPVYGESGLALTAGAQHLGVSHDGGAGFHDQSVGTGSVDAQGLGGGRLAALVSTASSQQYLVQLPGAQATTLPTPAPAHAVLVFNPAYPHVAAGRPSAFLSGVDPSSGIPLVQSCDAGFHCQGTGLVGAAKDMARLSVSPHVDDDHLVFASTSKAFYISTDDGGSFTPLTVRAPGPDTLITTVQSVAFTPDFDAARHTGQVLVALISVSGKSGSSGGTTSGGIYSSADGKSWSRLGDASRLDNGAGAVATTPDGHVLAAYVGLAQGGIDGGLVCMVDGAHWLPSCPGGSSAAGVHLAPKALAAAGAQGGTAAGAAGGTGAGTGTNTSGATPSAAAGGNAHNVSPVAAAAKSGGPSALRIAAVVVAGVVFLLFVWRLTRGPQRARPEQPG